MLLKKKVDLVLPTKDGKDIIILPVRLSKNLIEDLEDSGYCVTKLKVLEYYCPKLFLGAFLFYCYLFLQDLIRFVPFNKHRYFFFLLSLKDVYEQTLTEKQESILNGFLNEGGEDGQ